MWIPYLFAYAFGFFFLLFGSRFGRFNIIPKDQRQPWSFGRTFGLIMLILVVVGTVQRILGVLK